MARQLRSVVTVGRAEWRRDFDAFFAVESGLIGVADEVLRLAQRAAKKLDLGWIRS